MKIDNKCNELATKVNHQQAKNKDAHRAALFDRDMTIAKLQAEKKQAEVLCPLKGLFS
jgi:predicted 2-oxoglutarate/Fe(II)-dependent dioxygenase YbiX